MWRFILLCLTYISLADSSLAPFINKCKWDDSKCMKESAAKAIPLFAPGIPDLKVGTMDPMKIKHVDSSNANLKLTVTDLEVTELKKCEAKKITRDLEKKKLTFKVSCPANVEAQYDMNGQLFVLPIRGKGGLHVQIKKILINIEVDLDEFDDKDGKKHWKVKSWKHVFDLKEPSDVKFDNLFPDNEFLRKNTNELIAKNGNDVIKEIGAPIIKAIVENAITNVENFFEVVPLEDLILD